jgi:molybdate transport system ATP-binding protein
MGACLMAVCQRAARLLVPSIGGAMADELLADLQWRYPGFELNVSLRLPGQGVSVLFGPSGCGKTTVLRSLAGLVRPHGRVVVHGQIWQDEATFVPPHQRAIGYVFQEASLFPHLSVRQNLDYGWRRIPAAQRRIHLDDAVSLLGIGHLLARQPEHLSGGERQRVAIARALLTSPSLLLMDEPLSALDSQRKADILPYLEQLNRQMRLPMVYVTHAADEAARLADHLVLMDNGRVQASGPVGDMLARLDLPPSQHDEAAAVLDASVLAHDDHYGQSRLDVGGLPLWVGRCQVPAGQAVRVRVLARDVSVALSRPADSSIINILPARIEAMRDDGPDTVTLRLRLAGSVADAARQADVLLARITRRSRDVLQLQTQQMVFAQIKGAALMG